MSKKRMTGLDCLKEEMIKRGLTKQQAESKTVLIVLDILSGAEGKYLDLARLEERIEELKEDEEQLKSTIAEYRRKAIACSMELKQIIDSVNAKAIALYQENVKYIRDFLHVLETAETPEGRDALKAAQMFVNTINVDTKYDNTSFIIGLASILSQGRMAAVEALHRINDKIPCLEMVADFGRKYGLQMKDYEIREKKPG